MLDWYKPTAIMGNNSNYNIRVNEYIKAGMSKEEAERSAFVDLYVKNSALAFAAGAVSGGFFGASGTSINSINNRNTNTPKSTEVNSAAKNVVNNKSKSTELNGNEINVENSELNSSIKLTKSFEDYPYNAQRVLSDYIENVDPRIERFVAEHKNNVFKRLTLDKIGDTLKNSLGKLTGNMLDGYSLAINSNAITHIQNRHGVAGKHDNTMKNIQDIARIPYVVNNFDNIKLLTDEKGNQIYSNEFKDADGTPAKMVLLDKKINGTHYVAVAVPDSQWKKVWIASSYISKKGLTQVPNDEISSLGFTSETELASQPFSDYKIPQNKPVVKAKSTEYMPDGRVKQPFDYFNEFEAEQKKRIAKNSNIAVTGDIYKRVTKLTNAQRSVIKDLKHIGINAMFIKTNNEAVKDTNLDINGGYHNGYIFINEKTENPYKVVASHEVVHYFKKNDFNAYQSLMEIAREHLGDDNAFFNASENDMEEMMADVVGNILDNPDNYNAVFHQNMSLGEKIVSIIQDFIARLRKNAGGANSGYNAQLTAQLQGAADKIVKAMAAGVNEVGLHSDVNNDIITYKESSKLGGKNNGKKTSDSRGTDGVFDGNWNQRGRNKESDTVVPVGSSEGEFNNSNKVSDEGRVRTEKSGRNSMEAYLEGSESSFSESGPAANDRRFFEAVNTGDLETASTLLKEQAESKGYKSSLRLYHGTTSNKGFVEFNGDNAYWLTPNKEYADSYALQINDNPNDIAQNLFTETGSSTYELFAKMENILDLGNIENVINTQNDLFEFADKIGFTDNEIIKCWNAGRKYEQHTVWSITNTPEFAEIARNKGYDTLKAVESNGVDSYGVLYPQNIKSAKLITYDDNGNLIPLSKRFDTSKTDIRYSMKRGKGVSTTEEVGLHSDVNNDIITYKESSKGGKFSEINLTNTELREFYSSIGELERGMWFPNTPDGRFIIEAENKLVYTDGNYVRPSIEEVIIFEGLNDEEIEFGKEIIFDVAQRTTNCEKCCEIAQSMLGKGSVTRTNTYINSADRKGFNNSGKRKNSTKPNRESVTDYSMKRGKGVSNAEESSVVDNTSNAIDENGKVHNYLRSKRSAFIKRLNSIMNIPKFATENEVKPMFNEAWSLFKNNGRITASERNAIFEKMYENGRVINSDFYEQYKDLKAEIRNTRLSISEQDSNDIPDFSSYKKSLFNTVIYNDLSNKIDLLKAKKQ